MAKLVLTEVLFINVSIAGALKLVRKEGETAILWMHTDLFNGENSIYSNVIQTQTNFKSEAPSNDYYW